LFGSWLSLQHLNQDPTYAQTAIRECSLYVCATMHWRLVAPSPTVTDFSKVDAAYAWAQAHDMKFRGHSLLWHQETPPWFAALSDRPSAVSALENHVRQMCTHFAGKMQSWDVVNEAFQNGRPGGLRDSVFLKKIGPKYLDIAFRAARESDPKALL